MIYRFADCELDTDTLELTRAGGRQHVEPQVFAVLVNLARRRDRIVSREELLDEVWGHRFVTDATLSSRIKAARRAIGDSGEQQRIIRTLRGRGFRFVVSVDELPPEVAVASDGGASSALVGRAGELRVLRAELTAALAARRRVVLVSGEAGIGKSALLEAFLNEAASTPGVRVALGSCVEHRGTGEPYLPLLDALGRLASGPAAGELPGRLARHAPTWLAGLPWLAAGDAPRVPGGPTRQRMVRELFAVLEALCGDAALVLAIEDLHWGDPSTLEALAAVARRRLQARLLVVATYRPGGDQPPQRVGALAADLVGRGAATGLPLRPLSEALSALAAGRLGGELGRGEVDVLAEQSGGNPLLATSLLDGWVSDGALVKDRTRWKATDLRRLRGAVSSTLAEFLHHQLDGLPEADQRVLEAASVVGRAFSAAVVAAALDDEVDVIEARCRRLTRTTRIVRASGTQQWPDGTVADRFGFAHDVHRQVLAERLSSARRLELHRRVGLRLRAAWRDREDEIAAELAHHALHGRDFERAVTFLRAAARVAVGRGAPQEAAEHLSQALRTLHEWPHRADAEAEELQIQAALAPALAAGQGWGSTAAATAYARALELARARADPEALARVLYGLATLREYCGDYSTSQALMEERLALLTAASSDRRVESHELLACSLFHQGAFADALEHARHGIAARGRSDAAAELGEDPEASCHGWAALSLCFLGDADAALEQAREAIATAQTRGYGRTGALVQAARVHQHRDEPERTRELATTALDEARRGGFPYMEATALVLRGWARATLGDPGGADEAADGFAAHAATGAAMDRPYYAGLVADALARHGRTADALEAVEEALSLGAPDRPFFYAGHQEALRRRLLDV